MMPVSFLALFHVNLRVELGKHPQVILAMYFFILDKNNERPDWMTDLKHTDSDFSIQSCRSCYATLHLCQRSFYKIFVKFRNSKKNVLKMVLIIVNINKDENKSLISNQLSLKNYSPPPSWRTILRR
jgi:hypothetical protein